MRRTKEEQRWAYHYNPEDLEKFASIGEESPNWQKSFLITVIATGFEGSSTAREKSLIAFEGSSYCAVSILY